VEILVFWEENMYKLDDQESGVKSDGRTRLSNLEYHLKEAVMRQIKNDLFSVWGFNKLILLLKKLSTQ
jgi:hypothetical protein